MAGERQQITPPTAATARFDVARLSDRVALASRAGEREYIGGNNGR